MIAAGALIVIDTRDLAEVDARRTASAMSSSVSTRRPRARPRRASAGGRSRGPSATACRTRSTAPSGRGRAGSGSARWSPRRCRSPRTGASSTAGPRYIDGYTPRVNGKLARQADRSLAVGAAGRLGVERLDLLARERRELGVALGGRAVGRQPLLVGGRDAGRCWRGHLGGLPHISWRGRCYATKSPASRRRARRTVGQALLLVRRQRAEAERGRR